MRSVRPLFDHDARRGYGSEPHDMKALLTIVVIAFGASIACNSWHSRGSQSAQETAMPALTVASADRCRDLPALGVRPATTARSVDCSRPHNSDGTLKRLPS